MVQHKETQSGAALKAKRLERKVKMEYHSSEILEQFYSKECANWENRFSVNWVIDQVGSSNDRRGGHKPFAKHSLEYNVHVRVKLEISKLTHTILDELEKGKHSYFVIDS